jgi:broad specificity phosphatase PhoE
MDTAHAIARHHGLKVHAMPGLKEIHVGELEGASLDSFGTTFTQYMVDWQVKGDSMTFFGGENLGQFRDRVWTEVLKIVNENKDGALAVVSHYFVTATIVCQALGLPITHLVRIRIQPSSRTVLEFCDGYPPRLLLLSDTCHLREK